MHDHVSGTHRSDEEYSGGILGTLGVDSVNKIDTLVLWICVTIKRKMRGGEEKKSHETLRKFID